MLPWRLVLPPPLVIRALRGGKGGPGTAQVIPTIRKARKNAHEYESSHTASRRAAQPSMHHQFSERKLLLDAMAVANASSVIFRRSLRITRSSLLEGSRWPILPKFKRPSGSSSIGHGHTDKSA